MHTPELPLATHRVQLPAHRARTAAARGHLPPRPAPRRRRPLAASLLVLAVAAWAVLVTEMRGMDTGPAAGLGTLPWFAGIWATMTVAMMLPTAAPVVIAFAAVRSRLQGFGFLAGYLLTWSFFGLAAYAAISSARVAAPAALAWSDRGPWVAGSLLAAAGVYQLTPLKAGCLRRCRSPLGFLLHGRPGLRGAIGAGAAHGGFCLGCCAGLMLGLFALGVMSLLWMAVAAAAMLAERALPRGESLARVLAVGLVVLGGVVAVSPGSVTGSPQQMGPGMETGR